MLAKFATRLVQPNKLSILAKRNFNGVLYQFGPPRNKLSTGVNFSYLDRFHLFWVWFFTKKYLFKELMVMGVVLGCGILGPMVYIATNMQEYNGKAEARRKGAEESH